MRNGLWIDLRDGVEGRSEFGGVCPYAPPCPRCEGEFIRMLHLDNREGQLDRVWQQPFLDLLFCWRCFMHGIQYRQQGREIEILSITPTEPWDGDSPFEEYPEVFTTKPCELIPLPDELTALQLRLEHAQFQDIGLEDEWPRYLIRSLNTPHHQVLGHPFRFDYEPCYCPNCSSTLKLVATIADEGVDGELFTGNPFAMTVFQTCADCGIVVAEQQCD